MYQAQRDRGKLLGQRPIVASKPTLARKNHEHAVMVLAWIRVAFYDDAATEVMN